MQTDRDQMNKTNRIPNSSPSSEQNRTRPIIITIEHAGLRYLIVNGLGVSRFSSIVQQYEWLNGSQYKSIELVKSDWVATRKSPPSAIDYWGFDLKNLSTPHKIKRQYEWLIGSQYNPIELAKSNWVAIRKPPPCAIDSWGLGLFKY
ncbi:hypothetical protein NC652_000196 [Populus alba x Populus x berolinensis]|nr:hypothetical protein NC652_000196 [Populus alba x Populus x berolinensis]